MRPSKGVKKAKKRCPHYLKCHGKRDLRGCARVWSVINSPDGRGNVGSRQRTECASSEGSKRMRRDLASGYTKPLPAAYIGTDSGTIVATKSCCFAPKKNYSIVVINSSQSSSDSSRTNWSSSQTSRLVLLVSASS